MQEKAQGDAKRGGQHGAASGRMLWRRLSAFSHSWLSSSKACFSTKTKLSAFSTSFPRRGHRSEVFSLCSETFALCVERRKGAFTYSEASSERNPYTLSAASHVLVASQIFYPHGYQLNAHILYENRFKLSFPKDIYESYRSIELLRRRSRSITDQADRPTRKTEIRIVHLCGPIRIDEYAKRERGIAEHVRKNLLVLVARKFDYSYSASRIITRQADEPTRKNRNILLCFNNVCNRKKRKRTPFCVLCPANLYIFSSFV